MRWPWQAADRDAGDAEGQPRDDTPSPAGWAFLPPLSRTVGDQPTLTRTDSFTRSLPAWGNPSFMGPMSHLVSMDGPSGILDADGAGLGEPQETAYTPELPLPPRAALVAGPATEEADDESAEPESSPAASGPRADASRAVAPGADSSVPGSPVLSSSPIASAAPIQRLAVGDVPLASPRPVPGGNERPLPLAGAASATAASAQTFPSAETEGAPEPAAFAQGAPARSAADPRFNDGATNDGIATFVSLPSSRPLQRASESPAPRHSADSSSARRFGLGQPIRPGAPADAVQDRMRAGIQSADAPALPLAGPLAASAESEPSSTSVEPREPEGNLPEESTSPGQVGSGPTTPFRPAPGGALTGRTAAPRAGSGPAHLPTVGLLSLQRLGTAGLGKSMTSRAVASTAFSGQGTRTVVSRGVQQWAMPGAAGSPVDSGGAGSESADSRVLAGMAFATQSRGGAEPGSARGIRALQRDVGDLPLAAPAESGVRDVVLQAESTGVDGSSDPAPAAQPAVAPVASDAAVAGGPAPAAGASGPQSPQDVDALAEKLLGPLLRRIKSEMLLDRERRGLRTDAF
jgi:hypothetical protein